MNRRRSIALLAGLACGPLAAGGAFASEPAPIHLVVKDGKLVSGPNLVKLKRDDPVVLTIVADVADELHVHGYNLHARLEPHKPATIKFVAKRTGRFSFELHKSGAELGVFEIYPK